MFNSITVTILAMILSATLLGTIKHNIVQEKLDNYQWCLDEIEMQYDAHEWEEFKAECKDLLK